MFRFTQTKGKISKCGLQIYQRSYKPHPLDLKLATSSIWIWTEIDDEIFTCNKQMIRCTDMALVHTHHKERNCLFYKKKSTSLSSEKIKRLNCISDPSIIVYVQFWLSIVSCSNEIPSFFQFYFSKNVCLSVYHPITTKASDLANILHT